MGSAVVACVLVLSVVGVMATEGPDVLFEPTTPGEAPTQGMPAGRWSSLPDSPIHGRRDAVAVWTGDEVIVWGGHLIAKMGAHPDQRVSGKSWDEEDGPTDIGEVHFSDGAAYDPRTGKWRVIAAAPFAGGYADQAVWAGDGMLVWSHRQRRLIAYDPAKDSWTELAPPPLAGDGRPVVSLVWTGSEVIVWGGMDHQPELPAFGASYDVDREVWTTLPEAPVPARQWHTAVWTGMEMVVWGGTTLAEALRPEQGGASYNPRTRQWQTLPAAPTGERQGHSAVWTGQEMLVWGGFDALDVPAFEGIAFDPQQATWRELASSPLEPRHWSTMVWTGSSALVWGGYANAGERAYGDGATYDPGSNSWETLPAGPLSGRCKHAAAWTGAELFIWSGVPGCNIDPPAADGALLAGVPTNDQQHEKIAPPTAAPTAEPSSALPTAEPTDDPREGAPPVNEALMRVRPNPAAPGDTLELTFPKESGRGVAFALYEQRGDAWQLAYTLTSDGGPGGNHEPRWYLPDEEYVYWDIGIGGSGPDRVPVPDDASPGEYLVCTANAGQDFCAPLTVVGNTHD